jgi:nicotinamidase-related amidase
LQPKLAVIVVDMLNDFFTGPLKSERTAKIIPAVRRLIELAKQNNIPIIYANDSHIPRFDKTQLELWGKHAIRGTRGAQVINELKPRRTDYVVQKRKYSAFQETELDLILKQLETEAIIFSGILTNICIQHSVADAFFKGYRTIILEDCVEALSEKEQKIALAYMKKMYGSEIIKLDTLAKRLTQKSSKNIK